MLSHMNRKIFFFFKVGFCVSPEPYVMHTNWRNLQIFLLAKFCGTELNSVWFHRLGENCLSNQAYFHWMYLYLCITLGILLSCSLSCTWKIWNCIGMYGKSKFLDPSCWSFVCLFLKKGNITWHYVGSYLLILSSSTYLGDSPPPTLFLYLY